MHAPLLKWIRAFRKLSTFAAALAATSICLGTFERAFANCNGEGDAHDDFAAIAGDLLNQSTAPPNTASTGPRIPPAAYWVRNLARPGRMPDNVLNAPDSVKQTIVRAMVSLMSISSSDPVFRQQTLGGNPVLAKPGASIGYEEALLMTFRELRRTPEVIPHLNGTQVLHGSKSASLLAFTEFGNRSGWLKPIGQLEAQGKIPFAGEIAFGRSDVNQNHLSVVHISNPRGALRYAGEPAAPRGDGWTPEKGRSNIAMATEGLATENPRSVIGRGYKNGLEVETKRMQQWDHLTAEEKALVQESFPVLYGIRPRRHRGLTDPSQPVFGIFSKTSVGGEMMLRDGATKEEIRAIFVPADRVAFVQDLLNRNLGTDHTIQVSPLENWNGLLLDNP